MEGGLLERNAISNKHGDRPSTRPGGVIKDQMLQSKKEDEEGGPGEGSIRGGGGDKRRKGCIQRREEGRGKKSPTGHLKTPPATE